LYYNGGVNKKYVWRATDEATTQKSRNWYIAIGVIAVGAAIASFIAGDVLFSLLILLGAFALMLAGTPRPKQERVFAISERGLHIDARLVPWERISAFSIREEEPMMLIVATGSILGTVSIPLLGIDFRAVRTEFKNHNVEEVEALGSFSESIARSLGV